jgi:hypothetical protein
MLNAHPLCHADGVEDLGKPPIDDGGDGRWKARPRGGPRDKSAELDRASAHQRPKPSCDVTPRQHRVANQRECCLAHSVLGRKARHEGEVSGSPQGIPCFYQRKVHRELFAPGVRGITDEVQSES